MRILFSIYLVAQVFSSFSQPTNSKWIFGTNCGLDFISSPPAIISSAQSVASEGCASISDMNGNLLFFTDGVNLYTNANTAMANGSGLGGNFSSTQSALIIKQPNSNSLFYVFTTPGGSYYSYSIVDMSLAGGSGSVTVKNATLMSNSTERQVAIKHCNGTDVWIVTHEYYSDKFQSYLLTSAGLNTVSILSAIGPTLTGSLGASIGALKVSPDGHRLAMSTASNSIPTSASQGGFFLFDFDPATGIVSNSITLHSPAVGAYGIEFSADGSKLYGLTSAVSSTIATTLYQWNICSGNANSIASSEYSVSMGIYTIGSLGMAQRANDGKIYIAQSGKQTLHVIDNPNSSGASMNLMMNVLSVVPGICRLGLPNFINQGRIIPTTFVNNLACQSGTFTVPQYTALSVCSYTSNPYTAYKWDFGDNASAQNTASTSTAQHLFSALGTYTVKLVMFMNCTNDTITQVVNITAPSPTLSVAGNFTICNGDKRVYTANSNANSFLWSNAANTSTTSLAPTANTAYTITATSVSCSTSQSFSINVSKCTGLSAVNEDLQINIYPNPSSGNLNIDIDGEAELKIYNISGQFMGTYVLHAGSNQIDISNFTAGMYFSEVHQNEKVFRQSIVKTN